MSLSPTCFRSTHQPRRLSRRQIQFLIAALALCFLVAGLWYASRTRASTGTGPRHALAPAKLSESISVHAAGRGNPTINFSDGREVVSDYEGPAGLRVAMQQNLAKPLSLAAASFVEE